MSQIQKLQNRETVDIARRFGLKAALFASASGIVGGVVPGLSDFLVRDAKAQAKAKYRLRFGASVIAPGVERLLCSGIYDFVRRVEEKSGGEVAIQVLDKSQACAEPTCGERVINNVVDIGFSTAQNLGSVMPYSIALDWPFLWGDRTEFLNFLYSKDSNRLYRDVMRKAYGVVPLYASGEMRNVMMGLKYSGRPAITSPAGLQGAKIRITNSEMISTFAQSMKMNPIPLAFAELLEGLKSGVVDATEIWPGAAAAFGMASVLAQAVEVDFSPAFGMVFMSASVFDGFPDKIKLAFLEAAYETQKSAYEAIAVAQDATVGNGKNPAPDSVYVKSNLKRSRLTQAQRAEFSAMGSVDANAQLYSATRTKLDQIAGLDVYGALKQAQGKLAGKPLQPVRWWA